MTEICELETITEVLALIDRGLGDMKHRALISTDEVADLLLDVRTLLVAGEGEQAESQVPVSTN